MAGMRVEGTVLEIHVTVTPYTSIRSAAESAPQVVINLTEQQFVHWHPGWLYGGR